MLGKKKPAVASAPRVIKSQSRKAVDTSQQLNKSRDGKSRESLALNMQIEVNMQVNEVVADVMDEPNGQVRVSQAR